MHLASLLAVQGQAEPVLSRGQDSEELAFQAGCLPFVLHRFRFCADHGIEVQAFALHYVSLETAHCTESHATVIACRAAI